MSVDCPRSGGDHDWHGQYGDGGRFLYDACLCGAVAYEEPPSRERTAAFASDVRAAIDALRASGAERDRRLALVLRGIVGHVEAAGREGRPLGLLPRWTRKLAALVVEESRDAPAPTVEWAVRHPDGTVEEAGVLGEGRARMLARRVGGEVIAPADRAGDGLTIGYLEDERDFLRDAVRKESEAKAGAMVTAEVWKARADRLATAGKELDDVTARWLGPSPTVRAADVEAAIVRWRAAVEDSS